MFRFYGSDAAEQFCGLPDFLFAVCEGEEFKAEVLVITGFLDDVQDVSVIYFAVCDLAACRDACAVDVADQVDVLFDGLCKVAFDLLEVEDIIEQCDVLASCLAEDVESFF